MGSLSCGYHSTCHKEAGLEGGSDDRQKGGSGCLTGLQAEGHTAQDQDYWVRGEESNLCRNELGERRRGEARVCHQFPDSPGDPVVLLTKLGNWG